jgi:hypothetical protein
MTSFSLACVLCTRAKVGQQVQHAFDVQRLVVYLEFQPGDGLVEQTFPCVADDAQIMQELLHLVGKLVIFHRADTVEHRLIPRQIRLLAQQVGKVIILQPVQFKREEHQRRGKVGDLLLRVRHEFGTAGIRGQLVIAQPRVRHDAPGDLVDLLIAQHTVQQFVRIQFGQFAFVIFGKAAAGLFKPVQIALELGGVFTGVQVVKIPFRQLAEGRGPGTGVGIKDGDGQLKHEKPLFDVKST